jgi:hypothetical protein
MPNVDFFYFFFSSRAQDENKTRKKDRKEEAEKEREEILIIKVRSGEITIVFIVKQKRFFIRHEMICGA